MSLETYKFTFPNAA